MCLPVYNGTHIQADVLKGSDEALLHSPEVSQMVVDVDHLHAALEGALKCPSVGVQKVAWREAEEVRVHYYNQWRNIDRMNSLLFLTLNTLCLVTSAKEVMFSEALVCLFVCLFVCHQDY